MSEEPSEQEVDSLIRKQLAEHALKHLRINYSEQLSEYPVLQQMAQKWETNSGTAGNVLMAKECKTVYLDILNQQRQWLLSKNKAELTLDEDIIRRHLQYLDLEEEKLRFV